MKKYFMISLMALVVMTMTSCMHVKVGGKDFSLGKNGGNDTPTQVHQVGQLTSMNVFDNVNVAGPFNVFYEQGDAFTVLVKGTVEQLEKMTIYVKDDGLYIDRRENKWSGNDFKGLQVFVTAPSIKGLGVAGSGTITAPEALTLENLGLEVAGSGSIILAQLTCADLKNEIAGSGKLTLGIVQAASIRNEIAGSGDIDMAGLKCTEVNNEIAGSGSIVRNNVNVKNVHSEIAGSGNITVRGDVENHSEDIAGSGKVHIN